MELSLHAIILALNEETFIRNQLELLYPFCSGISVLTQYDRDWYGKPIAPDNTVQMVANFPDPEGKIHLILRRWKDEAAARNSELLSLTCQPARRIMAHGNDLNEIANFHRTPDYFWIIDADEIYDVRTLPAILEFLGKKKPRGMRVNGFNYVGTWNRRVPHEVVKFCHFGFLRPGILFKMRRTVSWNESRFGKLLSLCRLPNLAPALWGFIECPREVGFFHHGCWLGDDERLRSKAAKSSHKENDHPAYPADVKKLPYDVIPSSSLPPNIRNAPWPSEFFELC